MLSSYNLTLRTPIPAAYGAAHITRVIIFGVKTRAAIFAAIVAGDAFAVALLALNPFKFGFAFRAGGFGFPLFHQPPIISHKRLLIARALRRRGRIM
jgi:hypothetical protein